MTVIYVSDFDMRGSGYGNIAVSLCNQLTNQGYGVIALGLGYKGEEHPHPFRIIPAQLQNIVSMIFNLKMAGIDIEALIVALDIPLQERLLQQLNAPNEEVPYIGLFPIEAGPLCGPWAMSLLRMDARLIMSKFGQAELADKGVESDFIPIGVDTDSWRVGTLEERNRLRQGMGVDEDTTVVLTVADNQERKNLSRSMEIFAGFAQDYDAVYWMVTRPRSPVGWKLEDYAMDLGIFDRLVIWERGISFQQLWSLYAMADAMLLTSKAEGLAMPVLEAMATRLPVIGTKCAAIEEHLQDDRGLLIEPDYVMRDPWGNSNRYFASVEDGIYKMKLWKTGFSTQDHVKMLDKAQGYISERTWERASQVLIEAIERVKRTPTIEKQPEMVVA